MSAEDITQRLARVFSEAVNGLALVAAPQLQTGDGLGAFRDGLSLVIRELLADPSLLRVMIPDGKQQKRARRLMDDLEKRLAEGVALDKEPVTSLAREFLVAAGIPEPPGGWAGFQPPPDDDTGT